MHGNKGCLQPYKKWVIDIKNTRMHKQKLFYKNVLDLTSFSQDLGLFFLVFFVYIFFRTFFPETLLAAPILFWEKKSQESKTQDFIFSVKFFFRGFFPETFSRDLHFSSIASFIFQYNLSVYILF